MNSHDHCPGIYAQMACTNVGYNLCIIGTRCCSINDNNNNNNCSCTHLQLKSETSQEENCFHTHNRT